MEKSQKHSAVSGISSTQIIGKSEADLAHLTCSICKCIFNNPVITPCGHTYCKDCIEKWLETKRACPFCKKKIPQGSKLIDMFAFKGIIDDLDLKCSNSGCPEIVKYAALDSHVKFGCSYRIILCEKGCGESILQKDVNNHLLVCPKCPVNCDFCGESYKREIIEKHKNACPKEIIHCPLGCELSFAREKLEAHMKNTCENYERKCHYSSAGCRFKGKKNDLKVHYENNVVEHLNLTFSMNLTLIEEIKELKEIVLYNNKIPKEEIKKSSNKKVLTLKSEAKKIIGAFCGKCKEELDLNYGFCSLEPCCDYLHMWCWAGLSTGEPCPACGKEIVNIEYRK